MEEQSSEVTPPPDARYCMAEIFTGDNTVKLHSFTNRADAASFLNNTPRSIFHFILPVTEFIDHEQD